MPRGKIQNSTMDYITETNEGIILAVHAIPRAARNEIQGEHGNALKIRLKAPPAEGKANEALIEFLAGLMGVPRRQITLLSGRTSRRKRVAIGGISGDQARSKLK